jgi:hypothetical protein
MSGKQEEWEENFKRGYNGDYGVKLTPGKLRTFCEIDWPAFGVGWPSEGSLDKVIVNKVFKVVVGEPGTPRWFLILTAGRMQSSVSPHG